MSPVLRSTSTPLDTRNAGSGSPGRSTDPGQAGPRTPFPANRPADVPELQDGWSFRLLV
ncbi:hypothetical protein [Mesoterricola silvestris]|uniref:Uncharacterized protein n=1 Tax=Mesoterricola silvestris TaxID=2927979 RepID=A0AA48KAX3_9BACT|nr:hypothetical protein [Mesoterricola silvestris]BDU74510.1 hypothetical protein METEAL_36840 [Mesoterricola silvestris]